jgi:hypothetical protein
MTRFSPKCKKKNAMKTAITSILELCAFTLDVPYIISTTHPSGAARKCDDKVRYSTAMLSKRETPFARCTPGFQRILDKREV